MDTVIASSNKRLNIKNGYVLIGKSSDCEYI